MSCAREHFDPSFAVAGNAAAARSIRPVCSLLRFLNPGLSNSSYGVGVRPFRGSTSSN